MRRRPRIQPSARHARDPLEWVIALESRRLLAGEPSISLSEVITVPAGKAIQVPIAGNVSSGSLTYSVAGGTKAGIVSSFHNADNPYLDLYTTEGTLRFQLFSDVAPNAVRQISGLVSSGYYDGLNFHRVVNVNGFQYAQGGDPNGDGTGGPQFSFDDEFDRDALFTGSGQLATANVGRSATGKDANGSQFIVTGAPARALDFNHTIFGQLVRGGKTLTSILNAATDDFKPADAIRIKTARLVEDKSDAVLQLRAGNELGETSVIITARDSAGRETEQAVTVNVVRDEDTYANTPPILQEFDTIHAMPGQTIVIPIRALDLEGDDYDIAGDYAGDELDYTSVNQLEKNIVVRLADNAKGPIELAVGAKGPNAVFRGNITMQPGGRPDRLSSGLYDTQKITIAVGDLSIERAVPATDEFAALPFGTLDEKLIATFRADGEDVPSASHFNATINWGDGSVSPDARVRELRGGQFAVYGTHQYDTTGVRPITVELLAENGSAARIQTRVRVAEPIALEGRSIVITGTQAADRYWLRLEDDGTISVNGGLRWPASDVDRIDARLYEGDDDFDANIDVLPPVYVVAGEGNDSVNAGPGDDTVDGGAGDDRLGCNGGDDAVNAGDGDDTVLGGSGKNVLYGDAGDDRITGSGGRDLIYGGEGNDRLYGRAGDDTIDAGAGVDRLYGEDGNDLLIGGSGNDRVYGGDDDDILYGKAGTDTLNGGPGSNRRGDEDEDDILVNL